LGDKERALEDLGRALAMDPRLVVALVNRGVLLAATGEKEKARSDFEAVLSLDPGNVVAKAQLASLGNS
jgi:tetratricopeptide (TPR) repeat protein